MNIYFLKIGRLLFSFSLKSPTFDCYRMPRDRTEEMEGFHLVLFYFQLLYTTRNSWKEYQKLFNEPFFYIKKNSLEYLEGKDGHRYYI